MIAPGFLDGKNMSVFDGYFLLKEAQYSTIVEVVGVM